MLYWFDIQDADGICKFTCLITKCILLITIWWKVWQLFIVPKLLRLCLYILYYNSHENDVISKMNWYISLIIKLIIKLIRLILLPWCITKATHVAHHGALWTSVYYDCINSYLFTFTSFKKYFSYPFKFVCIS